MAYSEQLWQDAKKKCRLTDEDIARAKRLGLNPRSLIKNIPSKSEPWKAPVSEWLREMEEKGIGSPPNGRPGKQEITHNPSISFAIWSADFTKPTSTSRLNMTSPK